MSSDIIEFTNDLDWGKMYHFTVVFASDVLSDIPPVYKDICKCALQYALVVRGRHVYIYNKATYRCVYW